MSRLISISLLTVALTGLVYAQIPANPTNQVAAGLLQSEQQKQIDQLNKKVAALELLMSQKANANDLAAVKQKFETHTHKYEHRTLKWDVKPKSEVNWIPQITTWTSEFVPTSAPQ